MHLLLSVYVKKIWYTDDFSICILYKFALNNIECKILKNPSAFGRGIKKTISYSSSSTVASAAFFTTLSTPFLQPAFVV